VERAVMRKRNRVSESEGRGKCGSEG